MGNGRMTENTEISKALAYLNPDLMCFQLPSRYGYPCIIKIELTVFLFKRKHNR